MIGTKNLQVAFLGTYPPRECGIATFTQDISSEIDKEGVLNQTKIIALSLQKHNYEKKVILDIQQDNLASYYEAAEIINKSDIDILSIQHEYGIFGGEWGEYLINFLERIKIPVVTTLHTVLPNPNSKQKWIMNKLGAQSKKLITMANNSKNILMKTYGINERKIAVIHHGVPFRIMPSRQKLKEMYGYEDKIIISTFGLINYGKGLEYGIEAIAKVAGKFDNILYLVLGQTHPMVKRQFGEAYREGLQKLVSELDLQENVKFVDKYMQRGELLEYIKMSDIYMTPYLGKDQAVSGTLAYAVGYGKAIVSTPYSYAEEMLDKNRGLLADFRNADALAKCIDIILSNPKLKAEFENNARNFGKDMMWKNVSREYIKVFMQACEKNKKTKEFEVTPLIAVPSAKIG